MSHQLSSGLLRSVAAAALLVSSLAGARDACATESFPRAISEHLGAPYYPECAICHVGGKTGGGTVTTPFGRSARARGLVAEDEGILTAVLDQMRSEKVDSDADGVTDIDEIIAGLDPNLPPDDTIGLQKYGCVGTVAGAGSAPVPAGAALLVVVALAVARRRRRT